MEKRVASVEIKVEALASWANVEDDLKVKEGASILVYL